MSSLKMWNKNIKYIFLYNLYTFGNIPIMPQGPGTKQEQAGIKQGQAGTKQEQAGTKQVQLETK